MLYYNIITGLSPFSMTPRRLVSLLLLLVLLSGQALSLAHGIDHALTGNGDQACVLCLSFQHHHGPAAAPLQSARVPREAVTPCGPPAVLPAPEQYGYSSRAPPRLP